MGSRRERGNSSFRYSLEDAEIDFGAMNPQVQRDVIPFGISSGWTLTARTLWFPVLMG